MCTSVAIAITAPAGACSTHERIRSVDPTRSASSTTSCEVSGCTITSTFGYSARAAAMCSGRKRWCTEQWPFHSSSVDSLMSRSSSPPSSARGFHTRMSAAPKPIS